MTSQAVTVPGCDHECGCRPYYIEDIKKIEAHKGFIPAHPDCTDRCRGYSLLKPRPRLLFEYGVNDSVGCKHDCGCEIIYTKTKLKKKSMKGHEGNESVHEECYEGCPGYDSLVQPAPGGGEAAPGQVAPRKPRKHQRDFGPRKRRKPKKAPKHAPGEGRSNGVGGAEAPIPSKQINAGTGVSTNENAQLSELHNASLKVTSSSALTVPKELPQEQLDGGTSSQSTTHGDPAGGVESAEESPTQLPASASTPDDEGSSGQNKSVTESGNGNVEEENGTGLEARKTKRKPSHRSTNQPLKHARTDDNGEEYLPQQPNPSQSNPTPVGIAASGPTTSTGLPMDAHDAATLERSPSFGNQLDVTSASAASDHTPGLQQSVQPHAENGYQSALPFPAPLTNAPEQSLEKQHDAIPTTSQFGQSPEANILENRPANHVQRQAQQAVADESDVATVNAEKEPNRDTETRIQRLDELRLNSSTIEEQRHIVLDELGLIKECLESSVEEIIKALELLQVLSRRELSRDEKKIPHFHDNRRQIGRSGLLAKLVRLLEHLNGQVVDLSASCLHGLTRTVENHKEMNAAGAIELFTQLLSSGSDDAKGNAAGALWNLAVNDESRVSIATGEAIERLVELFLSNKKSWARAFAIGALANLALNANNRVRIAAGGAIERLVQLLITGGFFGGQQADVLRQLAAGALMNLALNDDNQVRIAAAGALKPLIELLSSGSDGAKIDAAGALANLALNADNRVTIAAEGAIKPLIELLSSGSDDVKVAAADALWKLARNDDNQVTIAAERAIERLVELVRSGSDRAKENAAGALANLALNAENRVTIAAGEAIIRLIELKRSGSGGAKANAARALRYLAFNAENRVSIAAAEATSLPTSAPTLSLAPSGSETAPADDSDEAKIFMKSNQITGDDRTHIRDFIVDLANPIDERLKRQIVMNLEQKQDEKGLITEKTILELDYDQRSWRLFRRKTVRPVQQPAE